MPSRINTFKITEKGYLSLFVASEEEVSDTDWSIWERQCERASFLKAEGLVGPFLFRSSLEGGEIYPESFCGV